MAVGSKNIAVLPFKHKDAALKLPICCILFYQYFISIDDVNTL